MVLVDKGSLFMLFLETNTGDISITDLIFLNKIFKNMYISLNRTPKLQGFSSSSPYSR